MSNEPERITFDEKKKKSMISRTIAGICMAVICLPALFFGGWFYFGVIFVALVIAIYEFMKATGKKYPWYIYLITYFFTISFVYWAFIKFNLNALRTNPESYHFVLENGFSEPGVSWYAIVTLLGIYFVIALVNRNFKLDDLAYLFMMSILIGIGFQCFLFLRYCPFTAKGVPADPDNLFRWMTSAFLFLFVVVSAFMNDMMAYFVGVFFGRHKMKNSVSPNKSWEGFFGGWILGGLFAFGFASLVDALGHPLLPGLLIYGEGSKWWAVVILCFTLPLIGFVGDLVFSLIKRHYGIKDYGFILGAQGGILDRVDSLLFCSAFAAILIVIFGKGFFGFFA